MRKRELVIPALLLIAGCGGAGTARVLRIGEEPAGPWWMQATAMAPGGKLDLKSKPWWPQASQLKAGERLLLNEEGLPAAGDDNARMLVRREKIRNVSKEVESIVWVLDDDVDGSLASGGDKDSDCYVVDYGGDGTVDRIVDYIDNTGDNLADEMDIRYFADGELRSVWCGQDLDGDGHMWDLQGYEYSHNFFKSDPYGNNSIYMNKYDPEKGAWLPISECPFAFFDTNGDKHSEVAVRISASPLDYDTSTDPDYANDARRYRGRFSEDMRRMGAVNVRYSFDIDAMSGEEFPLHYDCGFNLVGAVPYEGAAIEHFNSLRRPPQVTRVVPFERLRAFCDQYPARETGFTWHEGHDDTIAIGDKPDPKLDYRWEGVFWIWERRFMGNTGGPGQKWNVRREWSDKPATRREMYYSEVDRRIHLFGAREGWIEIGHFSGLGRLGEIRMFDTDGNGFFDRWEVYLGDDASPVRVTTVRDERARRMPFDYPRLSAFYTQEVLPQAIAANEKLLAAMGKIRPAELPEGLKVAMNQGTPTERRFAQDVAREMHYQQIRRHFAEAAGEVLRGVKKDDLRPLNREQRQAGRNSETAWGIAVMLEAMDVAYGQGDFEKVAAILGTAAQHEGTSQ